VQASHFLRPDRAQAASGVPWRGHRPAVVPWAGEAPATGAPDLGTQLEDLLAAVWEGEADWSLCDRIDRGLPRSSRVRGGGSPTTR